MGRRAAGWPNRPASTTIETPGIVATAGAIAAFAAALFDLIMHQRTCRVHLIDLVFYVDKEMSQRPSDNVTLTFLCAI